MGSQSRTRLSDWSDLNTNQKKAALTFTSDRPDFKVRKIFQGRDYYIIIKGLKQTNKKLLVFPSGLVVKNLYANAGDMD